MCDSRKIEQAVRDIQAGREPEDNFRAIYDCFRTQILAFFMKRNCDRDLCHDLTQRVFLRVYTGMSSFRGEAPFGAWLFQIAVRIQKDHLRSRTTQKRAGYNISLDGGGTGEEELPLDFPDPSRGSRPLDSLLDEESRRLLGDALMKLPEQMRKCMILRVHQELSYQEIAVVMGISVETVKAHLYQGRGRMRAIVASYYGLNGSE